MNQGEVLISILGLILVITWIIGRAQRRMMFKDSPYEMTNGR